jgi:CheY-like chemotaxis protein
MVSASPDVSLSSMMAQGRLPARFEAVPRPTIRRMRPWRASGEGGRGPHEPSRGGYREAAGKRAARLPSVLAGLTIVVVDDDADTLDLFAATLRACGGTIVTASTARDALALVRDRRPHVVLSDIAMPEGDGYWLVREIRQLADEDAGRVPVVAATAFGREHSRARVLAAGFIDHLQKPVDPEVLCRAIARAAGR